MQNHINEIPYNSNVQYNIPMNNKKIQATYYSRKCNSFSVDKKPNLKMLDGINVFLCSPSDLCFSSFFSDGILDYSFCLEINSELVRSSIAKRNELLPCKTIFVKDYSETKRCVLEIRSKLDKLNALNSFFDNPSLSDSSLINYRLTFYNNDKKSGYILYKHDNIGKTLYILEFEWSDPNVFVSLANHILGYRMFVKDIVFCSVSQSFIFDFFVFDYWNNNFSFKFYRKPVFIIRIMDLEKVLNMVVDCEIQIPFVLKVYDKLIDKNNGLYKFHKNSVIHINQDLCADIEINIHDLTELLLGGTTIGKLQKDNRITVNNTKALPQLILLFPSFKPVAIGSIEDVTAIW